MADVIPTHDHIVVDTNRPFIIDPASKEIRPERDTNLTLAQRSHNSERFTFSIAGTTVEGHDMKDCNSVLIHFQNIGQDLVQRSIGIYKVTDLAVKDSSVTLSWLIGEEATLHAGSLIFSIHFACTDEAGKVVYNFPTLTFSRVTVGATVWNSDTIAKEYPDIIAEFDSRISALENKSVEGAVLYTKQTLTPEQQAQARENIGIIEDPDIHAQCFTITEDGVLSLKPEYRGVSTVTTCPDSISDMGSGVAGSKNAELPKYLVIPEVVNGIMVDSLADGIFAQNLAIEQVVLPSTISALPANSFNQCWYLKDVYNTEEITSIGDKCFQGTALRKANFPNLGTMGLQPFLGCGHLVYADVGKVSAIPNLTFYCCNALNAVKNSGTITSVGELAFNDTFSLKNARFISDLTNIGNYGFYSSKVDYAWDTLDGCTFGTNATSAQLNPTDFWSACTFTPCENPIPTHLSQRNPLWETRNIGTSGKQYKDGCSIFVAMHIYCGLHNLALSSVTEFEDIVNAVDPNLLNNFTGTAQYAASFLTALGVNAKHYTQFNQTTLQALCDALAAGGYAYVTTGGMKKTTGHAMAVCGINSKGELVLVDSECYIYDDRSVPNPKCSLHYKKFLAPSGYDTTSGFIIVTP